MMVFFIVLLGIVGVYAAIQLIGNIITLNELKKHREASLNRRKYGVVRKRHNPYR